MLIFKELSRNNFVGGRSLDKELNKKRAVFVTNRNPPPPFSIHVILQAEINVAFCDF